MGREANKLLNCIVMAAAFIAIILFVVDKEWYGAIWAFNCLIWVVNCHFTDLNYYDDEDTIKKLNDESSSLNIEIEKLNDELYSLNIENGKLKEEIKKLKNKE